MIPTKKTMRKTDRCIKAALTAALAAAASVRLQRSGQYPRAQMRRQPGPLFNLRSSEMAAAENNFYLPQIINVSGGFWALGRASSPPASEEEEEQTDVGGYASRFFGGTLHMPNVSTSLPWYVSGRGRQRGQ